MASAEASAQTGANPGPVGDASKQSPGTLVIMGGAVRPDNHAIWRRMVDAAGGAGAKFAVIAAAAGNPQSSAQRIIDALRAHGANAVFVPVAPKLVGSDVRQAARDPDNVRLVSEAAGVFFTGGDQGRITEALLDKDGRATPVLDAVWSVYRKGGVIAGTSAGAAIMSSTMFFEPSETLVLLRGPVVDKRDISPGLGFIGTDVFIDQHVIARGRFARMIPAMRAAKYTFGLGVDENTALVVSHQVAEVVGASGVIVVDTRKAAVSDSKPGLQVTGIRLSYLEQGDLIDLRSRKVTPAAIKRTGRLLQHQSTDFSPEFNERRFYGDVLAKNLLTEVLCNLADNAQPTALGLAFARPDEPNADSGFEFVFRKGDDTKGYLYIENATAHYTVLDVELDVHPVRVAKPLYQRVSPPSRD